MFKKIFLLFSFILLVGTVFAWTPTGEINLRDYYDIINGRNASFQCIGIDGEYKCSWPGASNPFDQELNTTNDVKFQNLNLTGNATSSNFFGWLNWSWLQNIPSYIKDWSFKLNETDQRFNETDWVIAQSYLTSFTESDPLAYNGSLRLTSNHSFLNTTSYFSGNVGINTTSPNASLHVIGNTTNSAFFMNGNVGIGTTAPTALLDVAGTSKFGGVINTDNNWISGDGGAEGISVNDDGNVGIGTTAPGYKLDIDGNINVQTGHQFLLAGTAIAIPTDEQLKGYWALDDGSGTVAIDGSGNGNHGTLINTPTWGTGVAGQSLTFATNSYFSFTNPISDLGAGKEDFTISLWVNIDGVQDGGLLFSGLPTFYLKFNNQLLWYFAPDNYRYLGTTSSLLEDKGWRHLVLVIENQIGKAYLDGVYFGGRNFSGSWSSFGGSPTIGNSIEGSIDEFRIYDKALTEGEIQALYLYSAGNKGLKINARQLAGDLIVDSNGNVGIGTTGPNQKLEVAGTINATAFKLLDSNKIFFGTADDVSQTMDGSFFNITQEVGSIKMFFKGFLGYFFDGDVEIDGDLNVTGNASIKNPYGMFSSNESQEVVVAETVYVMNFSHVEDTHMMSLGANNENITIQDSGDYALTLSGLFVTDANNKHFEIFPQINGVNVPRSNTLIEVENAGTHGLISVSFILDLDAGDNVRIMYSSDDAGSMTVWTVGHGAGADAVPETPSMIMTLNKISEITI